MEEAFLKAWSRETSAFPQKWSPDNPTHGQCLSTAMIVQDHFGGQIISGQVNGEHHFWNMLPSGKKVDLTSAQLPKRFTLTKVKTRTRAEIERLGRICPAIKRRYNLLKSRFEKSYKEN